MHRTLAPAALSAALTSFGACAPVVTSVGAGGASGGAGADAAGAAGGLGGGAAGASAGGEAGAGGSAPACGDGVLEPDEACDDGNVSDGDACSSTCAVTAFAVAADASVGNEFPGVVWGDGLGFLVVWRHVDPTKPSIQGRLLTAAPGEAPTAPLELSSQGNPGLPQVGVDASGLAIVAWAGMPDGDEPALVRYRMFDLDTTLSVGSIEGSDAQAGGLVAIGASSANTIALGWVAYDPSTGASSLRVQVFDASGAVVGGIGTIDDTQGFVSGYPGPAIWPRESGFLASWSGGALLRSCPLAHDGQLEGGCTDLASTAPNENANPTGAYVGPNEELVAVWEKQLTVGGEPRTRIVLRRFDGPGLPLGEEVPASSHHHHEAHAHVARHDASGRFVIVWTDCEPVADPTDTCRVMARMFEGDGQPLGPEWQVNQSSKGAQTWPGVAIDEQGDVVIVWDDAPGDVPFHITGILYPRLIERGPPS